MGKEETKAESYNSGSPAALLGEELLFDFYRNATTITIAVIGGAVTFKLALSPETILSKATIAGLMSLFLALVIALQQQVTIVRQLKSQKQSTLKSIRRVPIIVISLIVFGAGILTGDFIKQSESTVGTNSHELQNTNT